MKQLEKKCPLCGRMLKPMGYNPHMAWHKKYEQRSVASPKHPAPKQVATEKSHLELAIVQVQDKIADIEEKLRVQRALELQLTNLHNELEALSAARKTIEQFNQVKMSQTA